MTIQTSQWVWLRYPETETFVTETLAQFVSVVPQAQALERALLTRTSSRLFDWLDHLVLADGDALRGRLADLGFEVEDVPADPGDVVYYHPRAIFPRLVLRRQTDIPPGEAVAAAIQVERLDRFLMTQHAAVSIEGSPLSPYRRACVWQANSRAMWVVERRGHAGFVPLQMPPDYAHRYLAASEKWVTRRRHFDDARQGMAHTLELARWLAGEVGTDTAAWIAFEAERAHWQRRNRAGGVQRARQEALGLGWANHDHHTFRSSRDVFPLLIQILETLGFYARERFYAGAEAGWGAQVMEQPACHFAVFADVDLAPDEVASDFTRRTLPFRQELGTVGLWCALHGESMLEAGLHHLAGRFDFDAVTADLIGWNVEMMPPFSEFSFLQQAFTQGERWQVTPERLARLIQMGQIDEAQRARFAEKGAVGSHLENIQRGEGFKGFNQQRVSDIIRRTDPRAGFGAR